MFITHNEAWGHLPLLSEKKKNAIVSAINLTETNGCVSATANKWSLQNRVPTSPYLHLKNYFFFIILKFFILTIFLPHTNLAYIRFACSSCLWSNRLCWFQAVLFHPFFNPPFSFSCLKMPCFYSSHAWLSPSLGGSLKAHQQKGNLPVLILKNYVQSAT